MEWTPAYAEQLARELVEPLGQRWDHVQGVVRRMLELTDDPICVMAAWLHDIGYAPALQDTGMHAIDGAAHLRDLGAPAQVVSLVAFHTGAEFEAAERGLLDELNAFEIPRATGLRVLTLADLTTSPVGRPTTVEQRLAEILNRYGPGHPVHRAIQRAKRTLVDRCNAVSPPAPKLTRRSH